ncbi:MAG: CvpA family protein [Sphingobacteriales bacterium]|nr:MAG: CvpA family protein [Sphingobacteriales bacterium]
MALDIIGVTLIIVFFIRGYMKGLIVAVFSVLAILLGIICSLKLSGKLAAFLFEKGWVTSGWGQVISYAILFIAVVLVVRIIAKAIETSAKALMMGWINSGIGGIFYAFMGAIIWSSFLWIGNEMQMIEASTKATSLTYTYFAPLAPWLFEKIGKVWPMVKDIFGNLQHFFNNVNEPGNVGPHR